MQEVFLSPAFIPALYFHSYFSPASDVKGFGTKMHARGGGRKKNPEKWIKKVNEK